MNRSLLLALLLAPSLASARPSQPALRKVDRGSAQYKMARGRLTVNGIRGQDVQQGDMAGDCYFLSPVAALAHERPQAIKDAFHERDGKLYVRFFRKERATGDYAPVEVAVDRELPMKHGKLLYAQSRNRRELWVPLLEKAYAKFRRIDGYQGINDGGFAAQALTALTGKPSKMLVVQSTPKAQLWDTLKRALDDGHVATASTFDNQNFRQTATRTRLEQLGEGPVVKYLLGKKRPGGYRGTGLWPGHAYSIWGVSDEGGKKFVTLRDPYGYQRKIGDRSLATPKRNRSTGVFKLPFDTFATLYEDVEIGG